MTISVSRTRVPKQPVIAAALRAVVVAARVARRRAARPADGPRRRGRRRDQLRRPRRSPSPPTSDADADTDAGRPVNPLTGVGRRPGGRSSRSRSTTPRNGRPQRRHRPGRHRLHRAGRGRPDPAARGLRARNKPVVEHVRSTRAERSGAARCSTARSRCVASGGGGDSLPALLPPVGLTRGSTTAAAGLRRAIAQRSRLRTTSTSNLAKVLAAAPRRPRGQEHRLHLVGDRRRPAQRAPARASSAPSVGGTAVVVPLRPGGQALRPRHRRRRGRRPPTARRSRRRT